ncbi:MAG: L-carnitine dehydratase/bile acid-inducible protein [Microbacteriaceae bacterium]|nr:L-carnitine dehydratase/bile acid-inducible protein [Microbacteriaceae bacterium]
MNPSESAFLSNFTRALDLSEAEVRFTGSGTLASVFAVSELASASVAAAGLAASALITAVTDAAAPVTVSRPLACAWFGAALHPVGWQLPSPWDAVAGDYRARDGWIRLHTNAPNHRAAALGVLGLAATPAASVPASAHASAPASVDRETVAAVVAGWAALDLENAVVAAGGCAAVMRSAREWARHPQGEGVAAEPLVAWGEAAAAGPSPRWRPTAERPLAGLRVLDLTRVIAGPAATRFLAGLGAEVLRIDPPHWNEPAITPEMTLGKRTARLDAREPAGAAALESLIAGADVLVSGYRPGALDRLVGAERRAQLRPGLVEVSLDAYGWGGPWATRRGFDSLVQMSSGIAEAGMRWAGGEIPVPLPVQALDHATGYLTAAAVLRAVGRVHAGGGASSARLSLARVAAELVDAGSAPVRPTVPEPVEGEPEALRRAQRPGVAQPPEVAQRPERISTPWGAADLLAPPVTIGRATLDWRRGPAELGSDEPRW